MKKIGFFLLVLCVLYSSHALSLTCSPNTNALLMAADKGEVAEIRSLLEAGEDTDVIKGCFAPLHVAAYHGHIEIVDLLLKAGAKINVVNKDGETPLHGAVWKGHIEIVDLLLKAGAEINMVNKDGETPLHWAALEGYLEIVDLLLTAGAENNVVNKKGKTPLHWAAYNGQIEVVDLLLKSGYTCVE